ncbi:hypothetical protein M3J09_012825 [Ascochyta lentis]
MMGLMGCLLWYSGLLHFNWQTNIALLQINTSEGLTWPTVSSTANDDFTPRLLSHGPSQPYAWPRKLCF